MNVLVVDSGFVGTELCREPVERGRAVTVLSRSPSVEVGGGVRAFGVAPSDLRTLLDHLGVGDGESGLEPSNPVGSVRPSASLPRRRPASEASGNPVERVV